MSAQLSLFDGSFAVITGGNENHENHIKCHKNELKEIEYMSKEDLFSGFNTIRAITFSYDLSFINTIMQYFDYGEIVLGADFMVQKDEILNELLVNAFQSCEEIHRHNRLIEMLQSEDLSFRTPAFILDHRKIYLLKADDGRTRVITSSANMTAKAWNGDHIENYEYDDSEYAYTEYLKDFETAWSMSDTIPFDVISGKKSDELVEGNSIIRKVKETNQTIVLTDVSNEPTMEFTRYTIDHNRLKEQYKELLNGVDTKSDEGKILINPKAVEKIVRNKKKKEQQTVKVINKTEQYPSLTIDYINKSASINDKPLNLYPSEDEVRNDINELFNIYDNYSIFVGDTDKLKESHFKLLNAIFAAPLMAKLRCECKLSDIGTMSLPMFYLVSSAMASSGKTFAITAALKLMTDMDLPVFSKSEFKKSDIQAIQKDIKGIPVFIDELDNRFMTNISDIVKNVEECENNQNDTQPVILLASNDIIDPKDFLRKRMIFIKLEGTLPSNIDQSAFKSKSNAILRHLGNGFYREYLRRMLDKVTAEIEHISDPKNISAEYYTDLLSMSAYTIIDILKDFGYSVPSYVRPLNYNDDYSVNGKFIIDYAIGDIEKYYLSNKKVFKFSKGFVIIELGNDPASSKRAASWKNTLPPELDVQLYTTRDYIQISFKLKEYEQWLGHKLTKLFR